MRSSTKRKNTQKKNQKEILELKNTMNSLKKSVRASTADGTNQAEETVSSKIYHLKLLSQRNKKKKMNRNEESVQDTAKRKNYASLKFQEEKTNKKGIEKFNKK